MSGLSRHEAVPSLLRTINGKPREPQSARKTTSWDAPPAPDPDSEDDGQYGLPVPSLSSLQAHMFSGRSRPEPKLESKLDSDDSEVEDPRRRRRDTDIKPTTFSSKKAMSQTSEDSSQKKRKRLVTSREDGKDELHSSQGATSSPPQSSGGQHLTDKFGHIQKKKSKVTFGKEGRSQSSNRPKPIFRKVADVESPKKSRPKFKSVGACEDESPVAKRRGLKLDKLEQHESSSDELKNETPPTRGKKVKKAKRSAKPSALPPLPPAPKPSLFIPGDSPEPTFENETQNYELAIRNLSSSSLSDPDTGETEDEPVASTCPWCGATVSEKLLKDFADGKKLSVRMQTKFCRSHTRETAKDTWRERGYPEIDWDRLPKRLERHHPRMLDIINGEPSHFRDALADNIKAGTSRTLKQEDNLNPGYYGPRGFNFMCDHLVANFGDLLKERAVSDRVIAGRGSVTFIQTVLVAELAMELIREDLGVGEEDAREMLEESKELGEVVHEDQ